MDVKEKDEIRCVAKVLGRSDEPFPFKKGIGCLLFEKNGGGNEYNSADRSLNKRKNNFRRPSTKTIRTALAIRSRNLQQGDTITIFSENNMNACIPLIASYFLKVLPSNIDTNSTLTDIEHLLKQIEPKIIFTNLKESKIIEKAVSNVDPTIEIVVFEGHTKFTSFSEFLKPHPDENNFKPAEVVDLKETVSIFFSSGSTGLPKGICLSHKCLLSQVLNLMSVPEEPGTVVLCTSSPSWITYTILTINCILSKACSVIVEKLDLSTFWNTLDEFKVTQLVTSPIHVMAMCANGIPTNLNLTSLKYILCGGIKIHKDQLENARKMLPNTFIACLYGQTELGGPILGFNKHSKKAVDLAHRKPESCGLPIPRFFYKIVDVESEEKLGPYQNGELRIKTDCQMNGYLGIDSSDEWDEEGYLKTGDLAYYDDDYCFYIVDRLKEMLKFRCNQVAPSKLEGILFKHPAVQSAVVIGLPHPIDGDLPTALIVLKPSYVGRISPEEIVRFLGEKVTDFERLRGGVRFVESLQTTGGSKYKRKVIRDLVLQQKI